VQTARTVTGHDIPMHFGDRRPGDPDKLVASYKKAEQYLGWKPTKNIKDIIDSAWRFHQKLPNGYKE